MLVLITLTAAALVAIGTAIYYRKKAKMSDAAFQKLTADVQTLTAEKAALKADNATKDATIASLQQQLADAQAATGTSDADVAALDAVVQASLDQPAVTPPAVDPSTPPTT